MAAETPLAGLVLAGGQSRRMQRDKAALEIAGETQLARVVALLRAIAPDTYVSVRADQVADPARAAFPQIVDWLDGVGPAAGILAALEAHPDRAWLVVAVDLPLLDAPTLAHLLRARRRDAVATAYRSSADGLPEPLCAIWEPASRERLRQYLGEARSCPRKFLIREGATLVDLPTPDALANMNTPDDYAAAVERRAVRSA